MLLFRSPLRQAFGRTSLIAVMGAVVACAGSSKAGTADGSISTDSGAGSVALVQLDTLAVRANAGRTMGDSTARVWVLMASDFECPACKLWHDQTFKPMVRDYVLTKKVRFVMVNFPLAQHINAMPAAEAGMCAAAQGKFWEMHDALFQTQAIWMRELDPTERMATLLPKQGVNVDAWTKCVRTHALRDLVLSDQNNMRSRNVRQTPTFFVGTGSTMSMIVGAVPYDSLRKVIEVQLRATRPGGDR
jgi:protein-disulfide isomerase